ncbi:MAG: hypothetical protein GEU71_15835 [Actinobacteria bacterium]|nr:hypothetical protein [Actinomycetota bacterium]
MDPLRLLLADEEVRDQASTQGERDVYHRRVEEGDQTVAAMIHRPLDLEYVRGWATTAMEEG